MGKHKRGIDQGWMSPVTKEKGGDTVEELLSIDQLSVGQELGPLEYNMSADKVKEYIEIMGSENPWYSGNSPFGGPIAPVSMVANDPLRLRRQNFFVSAGIHSRHEAEFFNAPIVGKHITTAGQVIDKHIRRGREYWEVQATSVDEDGRVIARSRYLEAIRIGRTKVDLKDVNEELNAYVRLTTPPVAVKMLSSADEIPPRAMVFSKDTKNQRISICQAWQHARLHGRIVALEGTYNACALGSVAMGFKRPVPFYTEGNLSFHMYTSTKEAGVRSEVAVPKLECGKYTHVVFAPLERANFNPDLILIHCNPAQTMRLVTAALWEGGGSLPSSFTGRASCADIIAQTINSGTCQVILPSYGNRAYAYTHDDEMLFTVPMARLGQVMEGLEATHRGGLRYPIAAWLDYEPRFPPSFRKLDEMWHQEGKEVVSSGGGRRGEAASVAPKEVPIGYKLPEVTREVSFDMVKRFSGPAVNIHTSEERARSQGFPHPVVAALMFYGYACEMMTNFCGVDWIKGGALSTVFPSTVFVGDTVTAKGVVRDNQQEGDSTRLSVDVWCETRDGRLGLVGTATCLLH